MEATKDAIQRLRLLAQLDLGAASEVMFGEYLWSVQQQIATEMSRFRAKVAVPSCNASGKTWLAARLALAFFYAYTPGSPCVSCGGPCRGSKVVATSSKFDHLKENLFGELETAYVKAKERGFIIAGTLLTGDLKLQDGPNHFIVGQSAESAEGMQGYHAAHKLIIGDEATSIDAEVQLAITRLMASSDSRLCLIYNPTTPDTYAARMSRTAGVTRIKIRACDTPAFTGEPMPPGANLITQTFLDELELAGMGPGTFEWTTSIEAEDWDVGDNVLIPASWWERQYRTDHSLVKDMQLGIDLAVYGDDENVIVVRSGDSIVDLMVAPSMKVETFFETHVTEAVLKWQPKRIVFDGDGPGAGAHGYADRAARYSPGCEAIGFRGGKGHPGRFQNLRANWYWHLRRRVEDNRLHVCVNDDKLNRQITGIHYTVTAEGNIRVESKGEAKKRTGGAGGSPDRADSVMYAFAYSDFFADPDAPLRSGIDEMFGVTDNSETAMYERLRKQQQGGGREMNAVLGVADDW